MPNNSIWLVVKHGWESSDVLGAFSSELLAEEQAERLTQGSYPISSEVEEVSLNEPFDLITEFVLITDVIKGVRLDGGTPKSRRKVRFAEDQDDNYLDRSDRQNVRHGVTTIRTVDVNQTSLRSRHEQAVAEMIAAQKSRMAADR